MQRSIIFVKVRNVSRDNLINFLASGIFQNLSITHASTWSIQDGPPETTSESLSALAW